jgi:acyl-CoA reductase-like NAD-dependent aldehyde dehydrogenase
MKITEKEFNALTGEETISEREETSAEKKIREKIEADFETAQAAAETRAAQRQAILDRLGLTSEEAALLLS